MRASRTNLDSKFSNKETYDLFTKEHGKKVLSFKEYIEILTMFNELFMTRVVETGKPVNMGEWLGNVKIVRKKRKALYPDWGQSNKMKQEILDRGGLPLENFKDENGVLTGKNNGGERWVIYRTDDFYNQMIWERVERCHPTSYIFRFIPARYASRDIMQKFANENPDLPSLLYKSRSPRGKEGKALKTKDTKALIET